MGRAIQPQSQHQNVPVVASVEPPAATEHYTLAPTRTGPAVTATFSTAPVVPVATLDNTVRPAKLMDSLPTHFRARTLMIGSYTDGRDLEDRVPSMIMAAQIKVLFKLPAGQFWRNFTLGPQDTIHIDVTPYDNCEVWVEYSSLIGRSIFAVASNGKTQTPTQQVQLGTNNTAAGNYLTPPGARRIVSSVTDAAFSWTIPTGKGGPAVTVVTGITAGIPIDVQGPYYTCGIANTFIWTVNL